MDVKVSQPQYSMSEVNAQRRKKSGRAGLDLDTIDLTQDGRLRLNMSDADGNLYTAEVDTIEPPVITPAPTLDNTAHQSDSTGDDDPEPDADSEDVGTDSPADPDGDGAASDGKGGAKS